MEKDNFMKCGENNPQNGLFKKEVEKASMLWQENPSIRI
ncbi:hypothetical protein AtDm6_2125 [Acetobacter tropicalis]|uniref:Uncharacterized protein n=1 Tax=Acetobacter tropicalis TaxID=104102 RepID=A0A095B1B8_9PROT|nr:hypothetical protein AtDm6_2125 [Acetobacter tropicalis]